VTTHNLEKRKKARPAIPRRAFFVLGALGVIPEL